MMLLVGWKVVLKAVVVVVMVDTTVSEKFLL